MSRFWQSSTLHPNWTAAFVRVPTRGHQLVNPRSLFIQSWSGRCVRHLSPSAWVPRILILLHLRQIFVSLNYQWQCSQALEQERELGELSEAKVAVAGTSTLLAGGQLNLERRAKKVSYAEPSLLIIRLDLSWKNYLTQMAMLVAALDGTHARWRYAYFFFSMVICWWLSFFERFCKAMVCLVEKTACTVQCLSLIKDKRHGLPPPSTKFNKKLVPASPFQRLSYFQICLYFSTKLTTYTVESISVDRWSYDTYYLFY